MLNMGRLCQSGVAWLEQNSSTGICMQLTNITSNLDNFTTGLPQDNSLTYKTCLLNHTFQNNTPVYGCRYEYKTSQTVQVGNETQIITNT